MISDVRLNEFADWLSRQPVGPPDDLLWARARRDGFSDVRPEHFGRVIHLLKRRAAEERAEADALEAHRWPAQMKATAFTPIGSRLLGAIGIPHEIVEGPVSIYPPGDEAQAFRRADEIMMAAGNACDWDLQDAVLRLEQAKQMILKEINTERVVEGGGADEPGN